MRLAAKVDINQQEIVDALIAVGATVEILARVGKGCPDLLAGFRGNNFLLEVKNGKNKLTPDQEKFFCRWKGQVAEVKNVDDALRAIGAIR